MRKNCLRVESIRKPTLKCLVFPWCEFSPHFVLLSCSLTFIQFCFFFFFLQSLCNSKWLAYFCLRPKKHLFFLTFHLRPLWWDSIDAAGPMMICDILKNKLFVSLVNLYSTVLLFFKRLSCVRELSLVAWCSASVQWFLHVRYFLPL